jgi:uncharacterized phage protein gp47/JayE
MIKTTSEVLADLQTRLSSKTDITNVDPGSVARTFLDVLSEEFYQFYSELDLSVTMGFVSTATGTYLNLIGQLLDCTRNAGETDDNYRARITNQVYVVAGANLTSIRLKALAVEGVKDLVFKQYTHGAGSFSCYVISESPQADRATLQAVQSVVDDTKAYGVYAEVLSPVLIPVELMVRLVFSSDATAAEKGTIRQNVSKALTDYANNLSMGESFILNEAIQQMMDVSPKIIDLDIYGLAVNNVQKFIGNLDCKWNERLLLDTLDIT